MPGVTSLKRVQISYLSFVFCGRGGFRLHRSADENSVIPIKRLVNQRNALNENKYTQVTRGYNIVEVGWAGVTNPHPQAQPPTSILNSRFRFLDSWPQINGLTYRQTKPTTSQSNTQTPTNQPLGLLPPNTMASMGTPLGSSQLGSIIGH